MRRSRLPCSTSARKAGGRPANSSTLCSRPRVGPAFDQSGQLAQGEAPGAGVSGAWPASRSSGRPRGAPPAAGPGPAAGRGPLAEQPALQRGASRGARRGQQGESPDQDAARRRAGAGAARPPPARAAPGARRRNRSSAGSSDFQLRQRQLRHGSPA